MPHHSIAPLPENMVWGCLDAAVPPVLCVASGDTVHCRTLDVSWGLEARRADGSPRQVFPREGPRDQGPALIGPIAVAGAQPGHILEVRIEALVPGPYGWTFGGEIGFLNGALNQALGVAEGPPELLRWELDPTALDADEHEVFGPGSEVQQFNGHSSQRARDGAGIEDRRATRGPGHGRA